MSSLRLRRAVPLVAIASVLFAQMAFAQSSAVPNQDPFAMLNANLIGTAERTLADALAERPWMKAATSDADAKRQAPMDRIQRVGAAVARVQQLRPLVEPILSGEGVPPQLIAVALVESGGQAMALSPKGARGVWQFMPDTARRYGLSVSQARDERVELVKSTRAAARYLRDLHLQFGDWQLTFAAYNAGEQAVRRAMDRSGQQNYPAIQRFLPWETRNYVPAVLDAMRLFGEGPNAAPVRATAGKILYANPQLSE